MPKISELPAAGSSLVTDELPVNQLGTSMKVTVAQLATAVGGGNVPEKLSYYGADPTGVADSTTAINNWLAYLAANGKMGIADPGTYKTLTALTAVVGSNWGFTSYGGANLFRIVYCGTPTDVDILTIGDGTTPMTGLLIDGLRVDSYFALTSGVAVKIRKAYMSRFRNITLAGEYGSANLWDGIQFEDCSRISYTGIDVKVQHDGIVLFGNTATSDIELNGGNIRECGAGVLIGGGYGGVYMDNLNIMLCDYGVLINNSKSAVDNLFIFMGTNVMLDFSTYANLYVDSTTLVTGTISFNGWSSSSLGIGINIVNWGTGTVQIAGAGRHQCNVGDAIYIGDATTNVLIGSGVSIDGNTGWGINGVATSLLYSDARVYNNTAGNYNVTNQYSGGGSGTPGGGNTEVQYNDGGLFAASPGFTYQNDTVTITSQVTNANLLVDGKLATDFGIIHLKSGGVARLALIANSTGSWLDYTGDLTIRNIAAAQRLKLSSTGALYMLNNTGIYMQDGDGNDIQAMASYPGAGVKLLLIGGTFTNIQLNVATIVNTLTASQPVFTDASKVLVSMTNQNAINTLTAVSGATNEHVLTKDTTTGNAIWKAAPGSGGATPPGGADTQIQYNASGSFAGFAGFKYIAMTETLFLDAQGTNANLIINGKLAADTAVVHLESAGVARMKLLGNSTSAYIDFKTLLTIRDAADDSTLATMTDAGVLTLTGAVYMPNNTGIYMKDGDGADTQAMAAYPGGGVSKLLIGGTFTSIQLNVATIVNTLTASQVVFTDGSKVLVSVANQTAINTLTAVSGATAEHVLTKDTATGNAIWKAVPAGGGSPGGSDTHVQYNSSGSFAGNAGLIYNGDGSLYVSGISGGAQVQVGSVASTDLAMFRIQTATVDRAKFIATSAGTWLDYTGTLTFRTIAGVTEATLSAAGTLALTGGLTLGTQLGVAYGGTNLTSIAAGSILAANSLSVLSAITSVSGTKFLKNVSGTVSWESTIPVGNGGTNLSSIAAGSILAANTANVLTAITKSSGTWYLQNVSGVVSWESTIGVASGGTGAGTAAGARTNLGLGTGDTPSFNGLSLTDPLVMNNNESINGKTTGGTQKSLATINGSDYILYAYLAPSRVMIAGGATDNNPIYIHVDGGDENVTAGANDSGGTGYRVLRVPN